MATLKRFHDLSPFTTTETKRFGIDSIKVDAESSRLLATNGRTAIAVPFTGNSVPTMLLPADAIKRALGKLKGDKSVELTGGNAGQAMLDGQPLDTADRPFPNLAEAAPKSPPAMLAVLSARQLRALAKYAQDYGAESIYFGLRDGGGACSFAFVSEWDVTAPPATGILAAMSNGDDAEQRRMLGAMAKFAGIESFVSGTPQQPAPKPAAPARKPKAAKPAAVPKVKPTLIQKCIAKATAAIMAYQEQPNAGRKANCRTFLLVGESVDCSADEAKQIAKLRKVFEAVEFE